MNREELLEKCDAFSLMCIDLFRKIENDRAGRIFGTQMLRSGTGIGSNVEEAQGAESNADFIHKLSIAYKEARETGYWLRIIHKGGIYDMGKMGGILSAREELAKILSASISTSKRKSSKC